MSDCKRTGETQVGRLATRMYTERVVYFMAISGPDTGRIFALRFGEVVAGRGDHAGFRLCDSSISREHACFSSSRSGVWVSDLDSRNGILVNGEPVFRAQLRDGDKVQLGETTLLKFAHDPEFQVRMEKSQFEAALLDGLTKTFAKKYFKQRLRREFEFASRHQTPLALILFEVQGFRELVAVHGAVVGDYLLSALAERMQLQLRTEDVFARVGKARFAILVRSVEKENVRRMAGRLFRSSTEDDFRFEEKLIPLTLRLGFVSTPELKAQNADALFRLAESTLLKTGGADDVRIAS